MELNFSEYQKLIGVQLKGKIIEETIGERQKIFRKYVLHPDSIRFLRHSISNVPIRVILPHTFYTGNNLINKIHIVINEDFVISQISIG